MSLTRNALLTLALASAVPVFGGVSLTYQTNGVAVPVSWQASSFPIRYSVDRRVVAKLGSADVIDRAFNQWTAISDARVTFLDTGIVDGAKAGQDGANTVTVTDDLFGGQRFIALTTNWYDENAHVKEADIQIDAGVLTGNYNVQQVVSHEVGHMLGLDHSAVLSSMMYPYVGTGGMAQLDSDDKIGITNLYPKVQPSAGATLEGRVFGDGGGIYAAQVVAISEAGEPIATSLTDESGRFEMRGVPTGNYRLYAEPLDGPVDVRNFSGNWRMAKVVSFPTQFADGGTFHVDGGKLYGNLVVNAGGSTQLNPKWIGVFDPAQGNLSLSSIPAVVKAGQVVAIALAGDGFVGGMTTFEISNRYLKRVSDYTYAGNYVYATFTVDADAAPQSVVIFVKNGNDSAALTGALRISAKPKMKALRAS